MAATHAASARMIERTLNLLRSVNDPLRNANSASRWIASLPLGGDALAIQKEVLDVVSEFPGARRDVGPAQVEALLRIDARLEPVLAELTQQYTINYQKSTGVESRLWHAVFDLVKAFANAYQAALKSGYPRAGNKRWRAVLPWALVRLAHYKGIDGKFRLFRYGTWIPAQWREFHELYEFARMRGWQKEQLVLGAGSFAHTGVSVESQYLKTLLLMRLDSGNFTPDQVEWVARQLEDWAPSLSLAPPPGLDAGFFVDLTGTQGLRRQNGRHTGGRVMYLDASPVYARIVERMRWLPDKDDVVAKSGEPPAREQKLLLMRLASLFGPEALAHAPRAARQPTDGDVRVVLGLQALTRAVAEIERLPDAARTPAIAASYDEVTQMVNPTVNPDSVARRIHGTTWRIADRSDTGCRLLAPVKEAPAKLGDLLAMREPDGWALAVVRRMQRQHVDEVTVGVEIIARRLVRVLLRTWITPSAAARGGADRPFFGIYLPAHPLNRASAQRSIIGPDDKCPTGGMVELDTGNARYLIRFTQTLERQPGWAWTLFTAVRKLTA